jgi:hypothetical protein
MADHDVTLMYTPTGFQATPQTIHVRPGQTIAFALAPGSLTGTIRIRFADRRFFATPKDQFQQDGIFHGGDGNVRVTARPAGRTTYHCELLNAQGNVIAQSNEVQGGGEILPDTLDSN